MEITKDNFDEALEIVSTAIKQGDFMAFDTEFTGFSVSEEDKGHDYDSLEDRYQKLKYVGERCKAIQFGLATFKWDSEAKEYVSQGFNFYLLRSSKLFGDQVFTMKADGMNFIAKNNFDFTKLYSSGITFERLSLREEIIKFLK